MIGRPGVAASREVWSVAVTLIARHGTEAAGVARERALKAIQDDRVHEFSAWHAVVSALETFLDSEPGLEERQH